MDRSKRLAWVALLLFVALALVASLHTCEANDHSHLASEEQGSFDDDDLSFLDEDDEEDNEEEVGMSGDAFDGEDFQDLDSSFTEGNEDDGEEEEEGEDDGNGDAKELDEKDVVILSSGNFSDFVADNHYVLVEFYAPWCGHCKALAPEYAEAATILKGEAVLAKVDATASDDLAQKFDVQSYPTLIFFIDGVQKPYNGHRRSEDIVNWVKRKTGPSVHSITDREYAEEILDSQQHTMAVAYLNSLEGSEAEEYTSAARQDDTLLFFQTASAAVASVFNFSKNVKRPALVLLKQEPDKVTWYDGPFERSAISSFVSANKLPLVITFRKETASLIFESPIKKQLLLFAHPDDYQRLLPTYKEASKDLRGQLVFVHVDLSDSEVAGAVLEFFGITGEKPSVMGFESVENGRKFLLEDELTVENIQTFGKALVAETLSPHLKSAPVPEKNDGDVKVVVGNNFDEVVLDESKDVILEIYAPWCGHCQALEPIWKKLGRRLRDVESIVIAKMDGTANEHIRAKTDGYPTILFFPAGKKSFDPIGFEGDRTLKGFVLFLKKYAAIPFTIPKKNESLSTEHVENILLSEETVERVDPTPEYVKDEL